MLFYLTLMVVSCVIIYLVVCPVKYRTTIELTLLLSIDYARIPIQDHNALSISQINTYSSYVFIAYFLYTISGNWKKLKLLTQKPILYLVAFWVFYIASGIYSIPRYGVAVNSVLLILFKVSAFYCVLIKIKSLREVYICMCVVLFFGTFDLMTGKISDSATIELGERDLGSGRWIRFDSIWIAQAIFFAYISSNLKIDRNAGKVFWKGLFKYLFLVVLLLIIVLGVMKAQLRATVLEIGIGFMIVQIFNNYSVRIKSLLLAGIAGIVLFGIWNEFSEKTKESLLFGIIERGSGNREQIWAYTFSQCLKSPLLGYGIGTDGAIIASVTKMGSHNVYMILALETGFIGLIIFIWLNVLGLKREYEYYLKNRNDKYKKIEIVTYINLHVTLLFHIFFHALIYFPWTIMISAIPLILFKKSRTTELNERKVKKRLDSTYWAISVENAIAIQKKTNS